MFKPKQKSQVDHRIYELLAEIVEYPTPHLLEQVQAAIAILADQPSRAARQLAKFGEFAETTTLGDLEELYTSTFDLKPVCYPYVGYQLFGDTYKRGAFLAQLNALYREHGFDKIARELPDHLGMILRFLAHITDEELINEGMIPTLTKMIDQLKDNPYRDVVQAVLTMLQGK